MSASRTLFCWARKPGVVPGSCAYQAPHSSTARATFFFGIVLVHDRGVLPDQAVHLQGVLQDLGVVLLAEAHRLVGRREAHHGVVVEREAVHVVPAPLAALPRLHDRLGPLREPRLAAARPDGDLEHPIGLLLRGVEVAREAAVDAQLAQVVLGRHVAAAVPVLVADAEEGDLVGRRAAVGGALLGERRRLRGGQVLQPVGRFLRRARADVDRQVGLAADLLDEVDELVRAERIRLDDAAPVRVERGRSRVQRADAVAPVVLVGEAAAGPAHVGHLEGLERRDDVIADAARVRDRRVGADPDAFVDALAEVLGELAEEVAVEHRTGLGRIDGDGGRAAAADGVWGAAPTDARPARAMLTMQARARGPVGRATRGIRTSRTLQTAAVGEARRARPYWWKTARAYAFSGDGVNRFAPASGTRRAVDRNRLQPRPLLRQRSAAAVNGEPGRSNRGRRARAPPRTPAPSARRSASDSRR